MSQVRKHFDALATDYAVYKQKNWFYYAHLKKLLARLIPPHQRVLEVGCGSGDLLTYLRPQRGYGIDISPAMISSASRRHRSKRLRFSIQSVVKFKKLPFDYIFMSDVVEHLEKPQEMFGQIAEVMQPGTMFVNTMANPVWEPFLILAEKLGLKMPEGPHYRWSGRQVVKMIQAAGMSVVNHEYALLIPIQLPFITKFANKYLEPLLKPLAFIEYFVATKP